MSDLSQIEHNFIALIKGQTDFNTMLANDGVIVQKSIAALPSQLQPALNDLYSAFKVQASSAVALGQSELGTLIAETENGSLETLLLNLLEKAGVAATGGGIASIAEQAALTAIVNGLHALLNRAAIAVATPAKAAPAATGATTQNPPPQSEGQSTT